MFQFYQNLSLRWKVPIRVIGLVLVTAGIIITVLLISLRKDIERDFHVYAETTMVAFSSSLLTPILHQDVWRAFEIIRAYKSQNAEEVELSFLKPSRVTVLDQNGVVFASSDPNTLPVSADISQINLPISQILTQVIPEQPGVQKFEQDESLVLYMPIEHNGLSLGAILVEYDKAPLVQRLREMLLRAVLISLFLLAGILVISWHWGRRFAEPLINLANCMERIGKTPNQIPISCPLPTGKDELGRLGVQFYQMTEDMAEKFKLEQQLLHGERMAALGRMISGIAHEVNNPLGGMLNAINTYKKRGINDPHSEKTIDLLERGLNQIRNTVSALLVEAKIDNRSFSPLDIDDLLILTSAAAKRKQVEVSLENHMAHAVSLPANHVRQIFLNLLLNAIQASYNEGKVFCRIQIENDKLVEFLSIRIVNSGETLDEDKLNTLFETNFGVESNQQRGFGLWIIYQLVDQLGGSIKVTSDIMTEFVVRLPITGEERD